MNGRVWPGDGACAFPCAPSLSPITHPAHWSPEIAPSVVILDTPHLDEGAVVEAIARRADGILADTRTTDGRHLVIAGHSRRHRLWIRCDPALSDEFFVAPVGAGSGIRLAASLQFDHWLHGMGPKLLNPLLVPTPYQRQRLVTLLCIADAQADGASLRDIAYALVFPHHTPLGGAAWKGSSERRKCQRLAADARHMIATDYRKLLAA